MIREDRVDIIHAAGEREGIIHAEGVQGVQGEIGTSAERPKLGVARAMDMKNVILDGHAENGGCDRNPFPQTGGRWCKKVTSKAPKKRDGMMLIPSSAHPFNSVILDEATVSK